MPSKDHADKRLLRLMPASLEALQKRAPSVPGGKAINYPLNSIITRYDNLCTHALRRVWSAISQPEDRAFVRFVLMGTATDDVTLTEDPTAYLRDIEEAMGGYEDEKPFTPNLRIALRGFGPLEAIALVDWVEQEKAKRE